MYDYELIKLIDGVLNEETDRPEFDRDFYSRLVSNVTDIHSLYNSIYKDHPKSREGFIQTIRTIIQANKERPAVLKERDKAKLKEGHWFLSNQLAGMSLYVDRFCGNIANLTSRLDYFERLGINFLHLMPLFESPKDESDGGYAVNNFRKIDERFGKLDDLKKVQDLMGKRNMYLMMDIVLNHTSRQHEWARKAKEGDSVYQEYFYFFDDRKMPDEYDRSMPEIFPESAPGNFTYVPECGKWVMTVFHSYQWDLNYTNPRVFVGMLDNIFFYANLGIDLLRIDAPAFIWKQLGATCQNLPQAHTILRLIHLCVQAGTPGMALLGEAIVAPKEIIKYFGEGEYTAHECDFAYNATQMALQWDALATGDVRVMMAAQHEILKKPYGVSWITYTRCHDDIGLGYEDYMIGQAGWNAFEHRNFLRDYFSGLFPGSPATGALFSFNPKTGDARISGTLASLCGLEKALNDKDEIDVELSIRKILLMQAQSFFIGGMPMIFYGDELGYTNDYSYLDDPGKSYDNRWMHRPLMHWEKQKRIDITGSPEERIFSGTKKLLEIRSRLSILADHSNLTWLAPPNFHVAAFTRRNKEKKISCLFNFSSEKAMVSWYIFKEKDIQSRHLLDHWSGETYEPGGDHEFYILDPFSFCLMEPV
jgi:amylosucrase